MIDTFVTIDLTEEEYDQVVEWLGEQEIQSGLGNLYSRLLRAVESIDETEEVDEQTDD